MRTGNPAPYLFGDTTSLRGGSRCSPRAARWTAADGRGGVDRHRSPVFKPYLDIVEALLRHQSYDPYVGRALDELGETGPLIKRTSTVRRLSVTNQRAAAMFVLNAQAMR